MTVKTSLGEYVVGGIYKHFKDRYYMIDAVGKLHDTTSVFLIIYHQCTEDGLYMTIRDKIGQPDEVIIHQPFATHETRWNDKVQALDGSGLVQRFKLFKQPNI